jgi:tetratricopeptide (TPR) repeat protein
MKLLNAALELNPRAAKPTSSADLKLYYDVAAADGDLRRGLELAPNYARGYEVLAAALFQSVARRREALEMIENARKLDPLEPRLACSRPPT